MAITLTVGGDSRMYRVGSLHLSRQANGHTTASFTIRSPGASFRIPIDAEVVLKLDATTIFGGIVDRPNEAGVLGDQTGNYQTLNLRCSAVDWAQYCDRRLVNETIPSGTLKTALTLLVTNYLDVFNVTLDAGQVDGPTLPELVYDYKPLNEVLNDLASQTAAFGDPYVWTIDVDKVLTMYQPADVAAPFDIDDGDGNTFGDIEVELSREQYGNTIIVKAGGTTTDGTLLGMAMATDATQVSEQGPWERIVRVDTLPEETTLQSMADAELAARIVTPQIIKYHTFGNGLACGQSQHVTCGLRNLDTDGIITAIVTRDYGRNGMRLIHDVTVTAGVNPEKGWRDVYKRWLDPGTGSASPKTAAGTTTVGPAPPDTSVQFNDAGVFGGDAEFTYGKLTNSLVCGGGGSSITAADYESCQVFGYDNHISD